MIKKILALILAAVMLMSLGAFAADSDNGYTLQQQAKVLGSLGVMQGDPDGNLRLEDNVTRAEFIKMAVAISAARNSVATSLNVSPFKDVSYTHWAAPYVRLAVTEGYVKGYSDFTFRPDNDVTFAEATTIVLKLLGYTDEDFGAAWPYGQMGTADSISLTDGITGDYNSPISRAGCVILLNNLLDTKLKGSTAKYASVVDCEIKESVILVATKNEDPSIASGKVYTTSGTYKIQDSSVFSNIGARGDILVKNGDEIILFIPTGSTTTSKMVVYSTLGNVVIGYVEGQLTQETIASGTTAYVGASASTFGTASSRLSMGSVMTMQKDSNGNIEYVSINEGATMQGPAIVSSGAWYADYTNSIADYAVIRNGSKASVSALKTNDVAYFAPDLKMMFVYANTKTGIYESASPNKDMPTSVTVSGVTYQIEGAAAFNALSSTGTIEYGDTVTILLGKDGKAAGAISASSAYSGNVYGFIVGSGKKNFIDENGNDYSSYYINLALPGGEVAEYVTKTNCSKYVNRVVKVSFGASGATVSVMAAQSTVYGTVDAESYTINDIPVSRDVKILEVSTSSQGEEVIYDNLMFKRLDGTTLLTRDILYFTKNSDGEIDSMIIEDVTGDLYDYGIMISANKTTGVYTYDIGGSTHTVTGKYTAVSSGTPARFALSGGKILYMTSISELSGEVESISQTEIVTESGSVYPLSDSVGVYSYVMGSGSYKWIPINDLVENPDLYKLNIYYDKKPASGGRVRIIIAVEK